MSKFVISGGRELKGEISVAGAKNAVFPLLAATLLTDEDCEFTNVPEITDKTTMVEILTDLGAKATVGAHKLTVNTGTVSKHVPDPDKVGKIRGSVLFLGALLSRFGRVELAYPGGDRIGPRPIGPHLSALKALGAEVISENETIKLAAQQLTGGKVVMEETSVLGTENAILAAVRAPGTTVIKLAAMEPHVQQLCEFLNSMGAKILGIGSPTLVIKGVKKLHGAKCEIIPDSEEAASLITLAAAVQGEVSVTKLNPDFLEDYLLKLRKINVNFKRGENFIQVLPPSQDYAAAKIQSGLYPKLNSDYVPPMAVLATQAVGETYIYEWLYENRLGYVAELNKMGARAEILDPHRVKITGPTPLKGAKITGYDLRMGMTMVIAALVADGRSEIGGIEHVDRGYENLEERLKRIGADINRID